MTTEPVWKDKYGRVMPIADLDNNHLKNCIKLIERTSFMYIKQTTYNALKKELKWREDNGILIIGEGTAQRVEVDETKIRKTTPKQKWTVINKGKI